MHLLSLENIDQFHLFLERLEQLVPLPLELTVLLHHPVQVLSYLVIFAGFRDLRITQLQLVLLDLFKCPVQLSFSATLNNASFPLVALTGVHFFELVTKILLQLGNARLLLIDCVLLLADERL